MTILRDVDRIALRAGLVARAEDWPHGSLAAVASRRAEAVPIEPGPVSRDRAWGERVNQPLSEAEFPAMRDCTPRGRLSGDESWVCEIAVVGALSNAQVTPVALLVTPEVEPPALVWN